MTTGADISRRFWQKVDKSYSQYYDNTKLNDLFRDAITELVLNKEAKNDTQFELDELNTFTRTEQPFDLTGGQLLQSAIPGYFHLKAMRIRTREKMGNLSALANDHIEISEYCSLRTGEMVLLSGLTVPQSANGEFYVRKAGDFKFFLFFDQGLTSPVSFGPLYYGGGVCHRILWREGKNLWEDTKISVFAEGTPIFPKYEQAQQSFKITPSDSDMVKLDYYTAPPIYIDVNNGTTDLETSYTAVFLNHLINQAVKIFNFQARDLPMLGASKAEIQENP